MFGIAHVPEDKSGAIDDASEALSETLEFIQKDLGAETS